MLVLLKKSLKALQEFGQCGLVLVSLSQIMTAQLSEAILYANLKVIRNNMQ
jgi:hypothetical protein